MSSVPEFDFNAKLDSFASAIADGSLFENLDRQLEEYIRENISEKPYMVKIVAKTVAWVAKTALVKSGERAKENLIAFFKEELEQESKLGKLIDFSINKWWRLSHKRKSESAEALNKLDEILTGKKEIDTYGTDIALVAKSIFAIEDIRLLLKSELKDINRHLSGIQPIYPLVDWHERFDPYDDIGKYLTTSKLIGRSEIVDKLNQFIASPQPIMIIGGPAGIGKTRIAIELCRISEKASWSAYFVTNNRSQIVWTDTSLPSKCVLVVDYAISNPNLEDLLNSVFQFNRNIKLLLIERDFFVDMLAQKVSSIKIDSSHNSTLAFGEPIMLDPLSVEEEEELFTQFSSLKYSTDMHKITLGNPLLTIIASEEFFQNDQGVIEANIGKNELLGRRLNYIHKYRSILGEDQFYNVLKILLISCLTRGINHDDKSGWLSNVCGEIGLPKDLLSLGLLIKQAKSIILGAYKQSKTSIAEAFELSIQPDMVASALLVNQFTQNGIFKDQLIDFIKILLPYKPKEISVAILMAYYDIDNKDNHDLCLAAEFILSYTLENPALFSSPKHLAGIVNTVGGNIIKPNVKPNKFALYLNYCLESRNLSESDIWCLCALTADLCKPAYMYPLLHKISMNPSFTGYLSTRFLSSALLRKKIPNDLLLALTENAYLNNPDDSIIKSFSTILLPGKFHDIEDICNWITDPQTSNKISEFCFLGLFLYENSRPEIFRKIQGLVARIRLIDNSLWFNVLHFINKASRLGGFKRTRRVLFHLDKLRNYKFLTQQLHAQLYAPAIVNAIHKITDPIQIMQLVDELRSIFNDPSFGIHPVIFSDALSNGYCNVINTNFALANQLFTELQKFYQDNYELNVQVSLVRAVVASIDYANKPKKAGKKYSLLKYILSQEPDEIPVVPAKLIEKTSRDELITYYLKAQLIALVKGVEDALLDILDSISNMPAYPIVRFKGELQPFWFLLDIYMSDFKMPLKGHRLFPLLLSKIKDIKTNQARWSRLAEVARVHLDKNEYQQALQSLEDANGNVYGIPIQNMYWSMELMTYLSVQLFGTKDAIKYCEKWQEKLGIRTEINIVPDDFPINLLF